MALFIFWMVPGLRGTTLLLSLIVVFSIGVWAAFQVEKTDRHDASIINIDEMVGMWLSLVFLPDGISWIWWIVAFFLFRFFDILKPFPVGWSQKLRGGWGVMMDDVLAGLYTNLILQLFIRLLLR